MKSKNEEIEKNKQIISNFTDSELDKAKNDMARACLNSNRNNYAKLNDTISITPKPMSDENPLPIFATSAAIKKIVQDRTQRHEIQNQEYAQQRPEPRDNSMNIEQQIQQQERLCALEQRQKHGQHQAQQHAQQMAQQQAQQQLIQEHAQKQAQQRAQQVTQQQAQQMAQQQIQQQGPR